MVKNKQKSLRGQNLILSPERALFWCEEKLLVVADPHFGKAQMFRDKAIPIPGGTTAGDQSTTSS